MAYKQKFLTIPGGWDVPDQGAEDSVFGGGSLPEL